MTENYELTVKDIWYKYIIPFFKWFGRSIKKTFTSKRLIAVVCAVVLCPLIAWGVFELKIIKEIEADTLLRSDSSFILNIDASKINISFGENGAPTVSKESYALTVAKEQVARYADTIIGDEIINQLYNLAEIRDNSKCLYENLDSNFSSLYLGNKTSDGVINRDYFLWAIPNYFSVSNKGNGNFTISLVSNRARSFSDYLLSKETAKEPTTDYENKQLAVRKLWPLLSPELMNSINRHLPSIIIAKDYGLLSLMDTTTVIQNNDGTTTQVNYVKNLKQISSPSTYTVPDPNAKIVSEYTITNAISWAVGGFFIGIAVFLIVDMIIAAVEGDRKYRGIETIEKQQKIKETKTEG